MPVTSDFIALANDLVIRGYKSASGYVNGVNTQPTFYIVLLDNGSVVAQLPVSSFQYKELSPSQQSMNYIAVDTSSNSYTFDEVQLWAGNQYMVTDDVLSSPVKREASIPLTVTVTVNLTTSTNTTPLQGVVIINDNKTNVPANNFWSYTPCKAVTLPMPVQNFIILLLLIPTAYYPNIQNSLFIQTYNQLPLNTANPLSSINGVTEIAVALPQVIVEKNIGAPGGSQTPTTIVYCTTVTPTTAFKPKVNTTEAFIGAFEQVATIYIAFITITSPLSTTQYIAFGITTVIGN